MPVYGAFVKALSPPSSIGRWHARRFCRRGQAHCLNHAILSLHDVQPVTRDARTRAGLGYVAEMFEDKSVKCLRPVQRKVVAKLAVEFSQQASPFDDIRAVVLP